MSTAEPLTVEVVRHPKTTGKRTLVAIPCYNEEVAIAGVVLRAKRYVDEVLVVDDGSKDNTIEVAKLAGATVIKHDVNGGKAKGVRTAFQYAQKHGFDQLILIDGDGQHNPDEIPLFLESLKNEKTDLALGFRFGEKTEMPAWRKVGKRALDVATAVGSGGELTDSQCGYRGFSRRAIEAMTPRLRSEGFGIESEMLVLAKEQGLSTSNVVIHCKYDGLDGSTKGPVEHALGVLMGIMRMVTERRPLFYISLPGAALFLGGFFLGVYVLKLFAQTGKLAYGFAALAGMDILLGATMVFMGVMLNVVGGIKTRLDELTASR